MKAAQLVQDKYGLSVEVIDLRSIAPLDMGTIYKSVKKTGRLVIAHEAIKVGGVGGEIAARVAEHAFEYLDAPILRVGAKFSPMPFSPGLEDYVLAGEPEITEALLASVNVRRN